MPEEMLTRRKAAEHIGVSDQTIYNWIAAGIFRGVIARGIVQPRYLIPIGEVEHVRREGNYEIGMGNKIAHYANA